MEYNKDKIDEMALAPPNHRSSCPCSNKFLAEMAVFSSIKSMRRRPVTFQILLIFL